MTEPVDPPSPVLTIEKQRISAVLCRIAEAAMNLPETDELADHLEALADQMEAA